jgi:hypothetical protein
MLANFGMLLVRHYRTIDSASRFLVGSREMVVCCNSTLAPALRTSNGALPLMEGSRGPALANVSTRLTAVATQSNSGSATPETLTRFGPLNNPHSSPRSSLPLNHPSTRRLLQPAADLRAARPHPCKRLLPHHAALPLQSAVHPHHLHHLPCAVPRRPWSPCQACPRCLLLLKVVTPTKVFLHRVFPSKVSRNKVSPNQELLSQPTRSRVFLSKAHRHLRALLNKAFLNKVSLSKALPSRIPMAHKFLSSGSDAAILATTGKLAFTDGTESIMTHECEHAPIHERDKNGPPGGGSSRVTFSYFSRHFGRDQRPSDVGAPSQVSSCTRSRHDQLCLPFFLPIIKMET